MSKRNDNDPVTERLCEARRQTIEEQINGLKRTIYVTSLAMTTVIVVIQFILTLLR
jgi:hypothetical protein